MHAVNDYYGVDIGASILCSDLDGVYSHPPEVEFTLTDSQLQQKYVYKTFTLS